jgi:hypothetical protein
LLRSNSATAPTAMTTTTATAPRASASSGPFPLRGGWVGGGAGNQGRAMGGGADGVPPAHGEGCWCQSMLGGGWRIIPGNQPVSSFLLQDGSIGRGKASARPISTTTTSRLIRPRTEWSTRCQPKCLDAWRHGCPPGPGSSILHRQGIEPGDETCRPAR